MKEKRIEKELSFLKLIIKFTKIGNDYHIILEGGNRPHIGCTVLAIPRPSLKEDGSISSTASVLNVTGHKDEFLCRYLAENFAARKNAVTVCTGGFHMDHITEEQIEEVKKAVFTVCEEWKEE